MSSAWKSPDARFFSGLAFSLTGRNSVPCDYRYRNVTITQRTGQGSPPLGPADPAVWEAGGDAAPLLVAIGDEPWRGVFEVCPRIQSIRSRNPSVRVCFALRVRNGGQKRS
jgi:hypothetical protein